MQDFWPKLTEKAVKRFEIFIEVKQKKMTLYQASLELGLSYRHTRRLYKRYKIKGIMGLAFQRTHT
ncbi:MAG: helix-turn-helix domain-containing protein, partial [bacterium]|nr:helix-turn-helix domain-containing protein [bacterium]